MIEIANRHVELLVDKLPRILDLARTQKLSLKQLNDIRQLGLILNQLQKKRTCLTSNNKNYDKKRNRQRTGKTN